MLHINYNSGLCPLFVTFPTHFANIIIKCHYYSENLKKKKSEKDHCAIFLIRFNLLLTACFLRLWSYRTLFEILFILYCTINVYNFWVYLFYGTLFCRTLFEYFISHIWQLASHKIFLSLLKQAEKCVIKIYFIS